MLKCKSRKIIDKSGNIHYKNKDGHHHRDGDLPAVEYVNGYRLWYKNGLLHRDNNKPAIIFPGGLQEWWVDGTFIKNNL